MPIMRSYIRCNTNFCSVWRSYAILSATTQFTSYAQNVHHQPKRTLGGRT